MLTEDSSSTIKRVLENKNIQNLISVRDYPMEKAAIKTLDRECLLTVNKNCTDRRCCSAFFVDLEQVFCPFFYIVFACNVSKVGKISTRSMYLMCSKIASKTPKKTSHGPSAFVINSELIQHIHQVAFLTLSVFFFLLI